MLGILFPAECIFAGSMFFQVKSLRRNAENLTKLAECDLTFAGAALGILQDLESRGFRPWIRQSWRSPDDQELAFRFGQSEVLFGFHNFTGPHGEPRSFAIDIVENRDSVETSTSYAIVLAGVARRRGLTTGILWGLSDSERQIVNRAVEEGRHPRAMKIGWDPCHVEPSGVSVSAMRSHLGGSR